MDITLYFTKDYTGAPFALFGPAHIGSLLTLVLLNLWLLRFRGAKETVREKVRWSLAALLWLDESAWHIWKYSIGQWTIQEMLPLHICSVLIWLTGFMLIFKSHTIYEFAYFLGIGGGVNALLTPDIGIYGFPHFRFFQTIISHGLLVTCAIYMTTVEGFRPNWKSFLRVAVIMNIYMLVIYFLNSAIGSNYMMLNSKPNVRSLYDLMPPWPYYLIVVEALGFGIAFLLYLPFALKDWRATRRTS